MQTKKYYKKNSDSLNNDVLAIYSGNQNGFKALFNDGEESYSGSHIERYCRCDEYIEITKKEHKQIKKQIKEQI